RPITAALVCRPGVAMPQRGPGTERDLGADQSNTSVVLGEELLLKAYRRIQPGLNPDLEMTAFLSEQARFAAVPPLAGFAELVEARHGTSTIAMAQQFVAEGADAFESIAASLTAWILAPGTVSVEVATEIAADLGALTAGLHAAVSDGHGMSEMAPRDATRDELRSWARSAHEHLDRALDSAPARTDAGRTLRTLAPQIQEALTILDALPTTSQVVRAHGDLHLGQILIAPDGFRIIDFEGLPLTTTDERRAHRHPLRDVASMLRSLDHVARSARRRADARATTDHVGLDVDAWIVRARERFLDAYRDGLLAAKVLPATDPDVLRAFEVDSELTEFFYAATYLPDWLYAPTGGIRAIFDAPS
ncbi:MAG: phosphotransferase, partial [Candidatus Limnocylindrales bacterium]